MTIADLKNQMGGLISGDQEIRQTVKTALGESGVEITFLAEFSDAHLIYDDVNSRLDFVLIDFEKLDFGARAESGRLILENANIPIIYIIANSDLETLRTFQASKSFGYILKPINSRELLFIVESTINRVNADRKYRELETEFKKNEILYRSAFLNNPDAICFSKLDGSIMEINEGFTNLTGYPRELALGKTDLDLNIWFRLEDKERLSSELLAQGHVRGMEARFRRQDGTLRDATIFAYLIDLEHEPFILTITKDITEHIRAKDSLRENRSLFLAFMDNIPAGVFMKDAEFRYTYLNRYCKEVLGIPESLIGKTATEKVAQPESMESERAVSKSLSDDKKALSSGLIATDGKISDKYGNEIHFHIVKFPIKQAGKPDMLGGFALDITAQKNRETHRQMLHDLFLALNNTDDPDKTLSLCLETAIKATGMDCGGIYLMDENSKKLELIHQEGFSDQFIKYASQFSGNSQQMKSVLDGMTVFIQKDSERFRTNEIVLAEGLKVAAVIPIYFEKRIIGSLLVASHLIGKFSEDDKAAVETIAAQISGAIHSSKTRRALLESEQKYRSVVDNANEVICVVQDGTFKFFNQKLLEITGYSRNELIAESVFEFLHPDDREMVSDRYYRRLSGESLEEIYTVRAIAKGNETRWLEIKPVLITWEDRPATLVFMTDMTERVRSQELLIQTEKMMSLGGLAAGMAHEINNPLGAILQSIQNIERRFSTELEANIEVAANIGIDLNRVRKYMADRDIITYLDGIRESGKRAADIILDMLKFSRKSESSLAPADLNRLINDTVELANQDFNLKTKFDFKNIKIEKDLDDRLPEVPCTETEIKQVLLNLLRNAAYALFNHGGLNPPSILLRTRLEEDSALIEVIDNGPGIDPYIIKKVFDPFFTTKPPGEGTGLGLSVSYMIVTANHCGSFEVESEVNKGARFIIHLPLNRQRAVS